MKQPSTIWVYADWGGLKGPRLMGQLRAASIRGKEVFSFQYEGAWLDSGHALSLDPDLGLFTGQQYVRDEKENFGLFMDSSPDRWGRILMKRREALLALQQDRKIRTLLESDYLLGVSDSTRMGALRYKSDPDGPFLNDNAAMAAPPITSIRTLEAASLELENEDAPDEPHYGEWMNILLAPGSSLGGARPKASVTDTNGHLWIAKFPSRNDDHDIGAWQAVVNNLAIAAGIHVAEGRAERFTSRQHTYLTKRFDRDNKGERIHFASAMTLLGHADGASGTEGVSYLDIAEFIVRHGAQPTRDLQELWQRIVFSICVSNTDDHLRNHGFLLQENGWVLSPAYDINPMAGGTHLSLNITEDSSECSLQLAKEIAPACRVGRTEMEQILDRIRGVVKGWRQTAANAGIPRREMEEMRTAFDLAQ